jgi:hypothetical protein
MHVTPYTDWPVRQTTQNTQYIKLHYNTKQYKIIDNTKHKTGTVSQHQTIQTKFDTGIENTPSNISVKNRATAINCISENVH